MIVASSAHSGKPAAEIHLHVDFKAEMTTVWDAMNVSRSGLRLVLPPDNGIVTCKLTAVSTEVNTTEARHDKELGKQIGKVIMMLQVRRRVTVAVGALLACLILSPSAAAFIQKLFPLQEFIDDSDFLFTATVEKVDADKPSTVLVVVKHLKSEAPFARIPINLTGDKQKHTPQLLKRIAPDLPLVVGVKKQPDNKFMMLAYTNGTWFQVLGQSDGDQTRWAFTHCEIYLRRTFKGTTDELKRTIANVLAGKAKAPPPNPKEPPGFGPVLEAAADSKP